MTSFIVVSKDKTKREIYLKEFYKNHAVDSFDVTTISLDNSVKQNTQSIGIEDIKFMQKKIFLKPLKSKSKIVILENAELLTTEAQNALLKVLEEPPTNTFIILTANTKETLLPTIISRCFVVDLGENSLAISAKEKTELETFVNQLSEWGIGEKLKKAEQLAKDKDQAIEWLEKLIVVLHNQLINVILERSKTTIPESLILQNERDSGRASLARMTFNLRLFQSLHTTLKTTNVNPRFAIENTLLNTL